MTTEVHGVVMLGRDHARYGAVNCSVVSSRVAASISVGADAGSPSLAFKGASDVPNEDAVLAVEAGPFVALAVADAHFGHEASHQLIQGIALQIEREVPASLKEIYDILALIGAMTASETESESTLVMVVLDRQKGTGFGISYGDSTAALVGSQGGFRQLNQHDSQYVRADSFLSPTPGGTFFIDAAPGDVLMVYTDGVDECHYRQPATSIRPAHIAQFADRYGADPAQLVTKLAECALRGVHGNPGGQDNLAIAAATTTWLA